jgi:enediyne biosynthesis protein E4
MNRTASIGKAAAGTAVALLLLAAAPARKDAGCPVVFTDVAASAGLRFTHDRGRTPEHHLPETMGSGLAWLDFDNDGWMDLYVVQSGPFPPSVSPRALDRL